MAEEIIIIGSGPAAYNASLYAAEKSPLVFEGGYIGNNGPGGQLTTTTSVDNYPGFPEGTNGPDLVALMREQAVGRGVRMQAETVSDVHRDGCEFVVETESGKYRARSVIVATGASARRLLVPGTHDNEFWQRGVSSCAVCDGFIYVDKTTCVIGGGDSALEEALYLARITRKVYLFHRQGEFRARSDLVAKARRTANIEIMTPFILISALGKKKVEEISIQNVVTKEISIIPMDGIFFGIGHDPNTSFLRSTDVELDIEGYIVADDGVTSVPGLFAGGDVCDKRYRQAVTAAASGAVSAIKALEYLEH